MHAKFGSYYQLLKKTYQLNSYKYNYNILNKIIHVVNTTISINLYTVYTV